MARDKTPRINRVVLSISLLGFGLVGLWCFHKDSIGDTVEVPERDNLSNVQAPFIQLSAVAEEKPQPPPPPPPPVAPQAPVVQEISPPVEAKVEPMKEAKAEEPKASPPAPKEEKPSPPVPESPYLKHMEEVKKGCEDICRYDIKGTPSKFYDYKEKKVNCPALLTNEAIDRPMSGSPPAKIPDELMDDFSYGGKVPVTMWKNGVLHEVREDK